MDSRTFIMLYKAMVRPHVEYANSVWSPYKKGDIDVYVERKQAQAIASLVTRHFGTGAEVSRTLLHRCRSVSTAFRNLHASSRQPINH